MAKESCNSIFTMEPWAGPQDNTGCASLTMDGLVDKIIWPADSKGGMHCCSASQAELGLSGRSSCGQECCTNQEARLDKEVDSLEFSGQGSPGQVAAGLCTPCRENRSRGLGPGSCAGSW